MFKGATATIWVTHHARAVAFYRDTLGLKLERQEPGKWSLFLLPDGFSLALHPADPTSKVMKAGGRGGTEVGLQVDKPMDEVVAELKARGVAFHGAIVDSPPVRLAFLTDPDGNALYLYERIA